MYKYRPFIASICCIIFMLFLIASFRGYQNWYTGFVLFIWLYLGMMNYRHKTSLWVLKNNPAHFILFYIFFFLIGIFGDYFIGQRITHAWIYPYYSSWLDWVKLYVIIYPIGGFSVLELFMYFGFLFHEHLVIKKKPKNILHKFIDVSNLFFDILFISLFLIETIIYLNHIPFAYNQVFLVSSLLLWIGFSSLQLVYHLKHGLHWLFISFFSVLAFLTLHEFPNTFSHEWRYIPSQFVEVTLPKLNLTIIGIPVWVILGWYIITLMIYKIWSHIYYQFYTENLFAEVKKQNI